MPLGISANKRNEVEKGFPARKNKAIPKTLRMKTYGFLRLINFCSLFPFSPSDVRRYASRGKNEKFCSKSIEHLR